ncbi:MAG: hypothetical protein EOP88_11295, partial [Verrucomicrobiaceae bacterium]
MKLTSVLPVTFVFLSAGLLPTRAAEESSTSVEEDVNVATVDAKVMLGTYVGAFGERKITICLDRVIGNTVTGYSIVAGNERAFSGSWTKIGPDFTIAAKEPGDHPHDGMFQMTWMAKKKNLLGEWKANDAKIGSRKFDLASRKFKYDPKAGRYPESSEKLLKEE